MGLGGLLHDITNGVTLGGMDMSILSTISLPDPEAQQKYEAMGLPDPVAFAALTALGAIPNPMAMLNAMMLKAEKSIDAGVAVHMETSGVPGEATQAIDMSSSNGGLDPIPVKFKLPGMAEGKSFIEAFKELEKSKESRAEDESRSASASSGYVAAAQRILGHQEEHIAKQTREAAEQAKAAADRAREIAHGAAQSVALGAATALVPGTTGDVKGVAQAFSVDDDANKEALAGRPAAQTLSALLGSQQPPEGFASGAPAIDKICIARLPKGVTDSALRLECARHGAVTSVILQGDGAAAYVTYATSDMAANAMRRILARPGALGSNEPLEVHLVAEIPENVRLAPVVATMEIVQATVDTSLLPEYLRPKEDRKKEKEKRSKSRQKSRSRSRRKKRSKSRAKKKRSRSRRKKRSKSRDRWLDRSRSHSHTATGQYIRATGCTSSVRRWERIKKRSSSSSRSRPRKEVVADEKRPRQLAVKGSWAQLAFKGNSYYYNIGTGQTQWDRPKDFDAPPSRKAGEASPGTLQLSRAAAGCLL